MRPFFLLLCLTGVLSPVFSQDYRIIHPARDYYYGDMNRVIHIDSVAVLGMDSLYFNYELVNLCGGNGPLPKWLSHPFRTDSAGAYVFENDSSETITLHSQSQPGTVWTLYTFPNGNALEASHTATTLSPFLGITDSVREIVLALKDSLGNPLPSEWNGKSFRLSQNHGLISTYNFDRFPQDTATYLLVGVSHPKVGQIGITAREIFDFEVGDEMHYEQSYANGSVSFQENTRWIILAKETFADSFRYEIDRTWVEEITVDSTVITVGRDTVLRLYLTAQPLTFPYELLRYPAPHINWYAPYSPFGGRLLRYQMNLSEEEDPQFTCWNPVLDDEGEFALWGLGDGFYIGFNFGESRNLPIYYHQGGIEWGTPFDFDPFFVGIDPELNREIRLSPNPFHDLVYVKIDPTDFASGASFLLYDSNGRRVLKQQIPASGQAEVHTETLPPGIYFYRITATNGTFASGKLVKQ